MGEFFLNLAMPFLQSNPTIGTILVGLGVLRVVMKPAMALIQTFVDSTPYDSDNQWLKSAEQSNAYKALCVILDWTASIKLPERPTQPDIPVQK